MQNIPGLVVTSQDFDRIQKTIFQAMGPYTEKLAQELSCAEIVEPTEVSAQVVTMNSEVIYEDVRTGVQRHLRLVYPHDADADRGWVSVLAPLGNAVLGLQGGKQITWVMPGGIRQIKIVPITYQPEAGGDWTL